MVPFSTTDLPRKEEQAEANNPMYPLGNDISGERECELYEPTPNHIYQYVDNEDRTRNLIPTNLTYDYAVADGPMDRWWQW